MGTGHVVEAIQVSITIRLPSDRIGRVSRTRSFDELVRQTPAEDAAESTMRSS